MPIPLYFYNFSINSAKKANIFFNTQEAAPNYRELPFFIWMWRKTLGDYCGKRKHVTKLTKRLRKI